MFFEKQKTPKKMLLSRTDFQLKHTHHWVKVVLSVLMKRQINMYVPNIISFGKKAKYNTYYVRNKQ